MRLRHRSIRLSVVLMAALTLGGPALAWEPEPESKRQRKAARAIEAIQKRMPKTEPFFAEAYAYASLVEIAPERSVEPFREDSRRHDMAEPSIELKGKLTEKITGVAIVHGAVRSIDATESAVPLETLDRETRSRRLGGEIRFSMVPASRFLDRISPSTSPRSSEPIVWGFERNNRSGVTRKPYESSLAAKGENRNRRDETTAGEPRPPTPVGDPGTSSSAPPAEAD